MPGRNNRGPLGEGPRTGHGRGHCGGGSTTTDTINDVLPELDVANTTIAIPTMDGVLVSPHLGRSSAFVLIDIAGGKVTARRESILAAGPHGGAHHDHGAHHDNIRDALEGVSLVLAAGAGRRIVADLNLAGIRVEAASAPTIDASIEGLLKGERHPVTG
jgi:predicted Fe-Mo cluster-binding NifX family protein